MKSEEIRKKTDSEIVKEIKNLKEELQRLRFRKVTDEIEDPSIFKNIRRDIARLETILRERLIEREKKTAAPDKMPATGTPAKT